MKKTTIILLMALMMAIPSFAAKAEQFGAQLQAVDGVPLLFDNAEITLDEPFAASETELYFPASLLAAMGMEMEVDSKTGEIRFHYAMTMVKMPFDAEDPYAPALRKEVSMKPDSAEVVVNDEPITLLPSNVLWDNTVYIPLQALSSVFDFDYAFISMDEEIRLSIATRMLSEQTAGQAVFASMAGDSASVASRDGQVITLGMPISKVYDALSMPAFFWGRGVPAAQVRYSFGTELEISGIFSRVSIVYCATPEIATSAGITVGNTVRDIAVAYSLGEDDIASEQSNIVVMFEGDALLDASSSESASHLIDFALEEGVVTSFSLVDIATLQQSSST